MDKNNTKLFIDSNFFIALYNPSDNLHKKAIQIAKQLQKDNPHIFISNFIFLETVTVLSQRIGRKSAVLAGNKLAANDPVVMIDQFLQQESWQIFKEINKKNISFVDCSILAIMKFENISSLLTFDKNDFTTLQNLYKFKFYSI